MLRFSSLNKGFSFLEVILTIALIGAVITPVMMVQYNTLSFMSGSRDKLRTIFLLDGLFPQASLDGKNTEVGFTLEKKYEDPAVTVRYEVLGIAEKSSLQKMQHLYRTRTISTPQSKEARPQQEISFLFIPPKEEQGAETKAPATLQQKNTQGVV
jgi:prepilin-type N-terminal cleavage/methylation domain-containing protein